MVGHVRQITFNRYLVFDPMVSPHYEVLMIPRTFFVGHGKEMEYFDPLVKESRWTSGSSSSWIFRVFSSKTGQWEERSFVREGGAPATNITYSPVEWRERAVYWRERAVYWRGALYLQRQANFVLRFVVYISFFICLPLVEGFLYFGKFLCSHISNNALVLQNVPVQQQVLPN